MAMRYGSLFSGIGGFDLGLERAGMECAWQVEIDAACQSVLKRHFRAEVMSDVKNAGRHNLSAVDVITGGFPCQDLSVAGRRAGLAGERSGLWYEFHRILEELRPGWVVIENVPGLLSSNEGRDFAVILRGLVELGYGVCWRVLDAQYFGVAQRRRRVFIVGHLGDGRAAEVLFEREGGGWDTAPSREKGEGTSGDVAPSINVSSTRCDPDRGVMTIASGQAGAEVVSDGEPSLTGLHEQPIVFLSDDVAKAVRTPTGGIDREDMHTLVATPCDAQSARVHDADGVAPSLQSGTKTSGNYIAWHNKQQSGEVRIQGDTVNAVTQQWGTGGNNVPFIGVRRLTPTECERLQGFPDGWTDGQSDSARYRQLGNAVAVPCAEWIARQIMEAIR